MSETKKPPLVNILSPIVTSFRHVSKPWGAFTSITGFAGDVLKPSAFIAPYFIILSTLCFLVSFLILRIKIKKEGVQNAFNSKLGGFTAFSFLSILGWSILLFLYSVTPPRGVAATYIPGLAELQNKILNLEQDVTELKKTSHQLDDKINQLSKNGSLLSNPKDAAEIYHNAKIYELNGNSEEAIRSYSNFVLLEPNYVDVHQNYQTLLINSKNLMSAQAVYESLSKQFPKNSIVQMMTIHLNPNSSERITPLLELSKQNPKVGPIDFELAESYLQAGEGNINPLFLKGAKNYFEQFKKADESGNLKKYFLDKRALEKWYQRTSSFEKRLKSVYQAILQKPFVVQFNFKRKWIDISMIPYERNVQKIFYSIDQPPPDRTTGESSQKNPLNGKYLPNFGVSGKLKPGKHTLYLKYLNERGEESQVMAEAFEVPLILSGYSLSPENDLLSRSVTYRVWMASMTDVHYQYFYAIDSDKNYQLVKPIDSKDNKVSFDITLPSEKHDLSYYGVSANGKTAIYHLILE